MTTIKFIEARFVEGDVSDVEDRLKEFLKTFWKRKMATGLLVTDGVLPAVDTLVLDDFGDDLMKGVDLSYNDMKKIRRRAATLFQRRMTQSGFSHLKPEEIKRLSVFKAGAKLTPPGDEHWADEIAAALHPEMPWMAPATEAAWHALRRSAQCGDVGLHLAPLLLNGPAGIGKSVWARRFAEMCVVPSCVIEVGSGSAGFRIDLSLDLPIWLTPRAPLKTQANLARKSISYSSR